MECFLLKTLVFPLYTSYQSQKVTEAGRVFLLVRFGSYGQSICHVTDFWCGAKFECTILLFWFSCRGSITALAFSMNGLWLISASEDCTARVWDIVTGQVIRTFDHRKGNILHYITSLFNKLVI